MKEEGYTTIPVQLERKTELTWQQTIDYFYAPCPKYKTIHDLTTP